MNPLNAFKRRGFRIHPPAADAIGGQTPSQQNEDAQKVAELTDPVTGGLLPQDRLKQYNGGNQ